MTLKVFSSIIRAAFSSTLAGLFAEKNLPHKRAKESGNVFFTLFGAIALIGMVGVATTTLMRGPVGTVLTLNQRAKVESQLQIARKLVALEATTVADCDGDADFLEPLPPNTTADADPLKDCSSLISGGGCLPSTIGAAKSDPWGTQVGYCGWNHGPVTTGCTGIRRGENKTSEMVLAVISAGPDRTFQSSCNDATTYLTQAGDDIAFSWTYDEAGQGLGGGLWKLKSGDPNTMVPDGKNLEIASDSTFASGSTASFEGEAAFGSGSKASFGAGSLLDLAAGGAFMLPTEGASGACNSGNTGLLRRKISGGAEILQICDYGHVSSVNDWVDIGGSGSSVAAVGADGNIQFAIGGLMASSNNLNWSGTGLDIIGTLGASGNATIGGTLGVAGATTLGSTLGVTGVTTLNDNLNVVGSASAVDFDGSLNVDGNTDLHGTLNVEGVVSDADSDVVIGDGLNITGSTDIDTNLNVDGTTDLRGTLNVEGAIYDANSNVTINDGLNVSGGTTLQSTLDAQGTISNSSGDVVIGDRLDVRGDIVNTSGFVTIADIFSLNSMGETEGGDCSSYAAGAITFDSAADQLLVCSSDAGNLWVTVGTSDGGGGSVGGKWDYANVLPDIKYTLGDVGIGLADPTAPLHVSGAVKFENGDFSLSEGDFLVSGTYTGVASVPVTGAGTRMFFDPESAAFRVGHAWNTEWDNANIGLYSFAAGQGTIASNHTSTALGFLSEATGAGSTALGYIAEAHGTNSVALGNEVVSSGNYSTAMGGFSEASGFGSTAMGRYVRTGDGVIEGAPTLGAGHGHYAMAIGLLDGTQTTKPQVTGDRSFGIFMGNGADAQSGIDITASDLMALLGGRLLIDPSQPATQTNVSGVLDLDVQGEIGAIQYCDETGANCFTAADITGGGTGIWEDASNVIRPNSGIVSYASADFLFGSPQMNTDSNPNHDNRFFFDKSKGAFRAGTTSGSQWNDTQIGDYSVAFGASTEASGNNSTALGWATNATGSISTSIGAATYATGARSFVAGYHSRANATDSYAIGRDTVADGIGSFAIGLTDSAQGIYPKVTGARSLGIFMGNGVDSQSGVDVTASDVMALLGGSMVIDPAQPATRTAPATGGEQNLELNVVGDIGATNYCDVDGNSCFTASTIAGLASNTAAAGADRQIQFNSGGSMGASSGLVWTAAGRLGVGTASPGYPMQVHTGNGGKFVIGDASLGRGMGFRYHNSTSIFSPGSAVSTAFIEGLSSVNTIVIEENLGVDAKNAGSPALIVEAAPSHTASIVEVRTSGSTNGDVLTIDATGDLSLGAASADGTLKLDVNGNIGADNYCDALGNNCFAAADVSGGGGASALNDLSDAYTDSNSNIAIGDGAGTSGTPGRYNVALGRFALRSLDATCSGGVDCDRNVALGYNALSATTTGYNNTGAGYNVLAQNTTGYGNTAYGTFALYYNTTGTNNTANGELALYNNTTGGMNAAFGRQSMQSNTTGYGNVAMGGYSLWSNSARSYNVAIGNDAMRYADNSTTYSASYNTAVGASALQGSTTAANNTGLFNTALGGRALQSTTSGRNNVAIGHQAGDLNTTGSLNILIGSGGVDAPTASSNYYLNIGNAIYGAMDTDETSAVGDGAASLTIDGDLTITGTCTGCGGGGGLSLPINVENDIEIMNYGTSGTTFMRHIPADMSLALGEGAGTSLNDLNDAQFNILIGYNAGNVLSSGDDNIVIGAYAGDALTTGYANMLLGSHAGGALTTGYRNTLIGYNAGSKVNTQTTNTMIGYFAGLNMAGASNTMVGGYAGQSNASGNYNTYLGMNAGRYGSSITGNTSVGVNAGSRSAMNYNSYFGYRAGSEIGNGQQNAAFGAYAGEGSTSASDISYNSLFGYRAGLGLVTGADKNTFMGYQAGYNVTTGAQNILLGADTDTPSATTNYYLNIGNAIYGAMDTDATSAVGDGAASLTIDGDLTITGTCTGCGGGGGALNDLSDAYTDYATDFNMYVGSGAGNSSSAGRYNVALGLNALSALDTTCASGSDCDFNVAFGYSALKSNTVGFGNVGVGTSSLYSNTTGDANIAAGTQALYFNTTGMYNIGIGYYALYSNKANSGSVAVGYEAMRYANDTTSGSIRNNTAVGYQALRGSGLASSNTGSSNTAVGAQSLYSITTGLANVGMGAGSLQDNTSGGQNVAAGFWALYNNTTGSGNTAIGHQAGDLLTTGKRNVLIGYQADVPTNATDYYLNIGNAIYGAMDTDTTSAVGDNAASITIDGSLAVNTDITYTGMITDVSDRRLKTDITPLGAQDMLERLAEVGTYSFRMKDDPNGKVELGVMAQDVEKVFPELVKTANDEMSTKSVNYIGFIAPLIEANNALALENQALELRLAALENDMKGLKAHTGYGIFKAAFSVWMVLALMLAVAGGAGFILMIKGQGLKQEE